MLKIEICCLEAESLLKSFIAMFAHLFTGPNFHIHKSIFAGTNISSELFVKFFNSTLSSEVTQLPM